MSEYVKRKLAFKAAAWVLFKGETKKNKVEIIAFERDFKRDIDGSLLIDDQGEIITDERKGYEAFVNTNGDKSSAIAGTLFFSDNPKAPAKFSEVIHDSGSGQTTGRDSFGETLILFPVTTGKDGSPLKKADGTPAKPFASGLIRTHEQAITVKKALDAMRQIKDQGSAEYKTAKKHYYQSAKDGLSTAFTVTYGGDKLHLHQAEPTQSQAKKATENTYHP